MDDNILIIININHGIQFIRYSCYNYTYIYRYMFVSGQNTFYYSQLIYRFSSTSIMNLRGYIPNFKYVPRKHKLPQEFHQKKKKSSHRNDVNCHINYIIFTSQNSHVDKKNKKCYSRLISNSI